MKNKIISVISVVLILCLGIMIFTACNKDEKPAPISLGFQTHELEIQAIGAQGVELFLDIENGEGWEITLESTGIVKNAVFDRDNESVSFTVDPSIATKVLYGTITLTATKKGYEPVTAVLNITQNFPERTIVEFKDNSAIFVDKEGASGTLDLYLIRTDGWTVTAEATGCISNAVLDKEARTISYTVPANTKSYTITGEIILKAEKDGEETITDTVNIWQEPTTYYLKKETKENRFTSVTTEYTYDEDGQIIQLKESTANTGSDPHYIVTETYAYDGDNYVKTVTELSSGKTTEKRITSIGKENGYEETEEILLDSVWTNKTKITVTYKESDGGVETAETHKYTWTDNAWSETEVITATATTETSGATIRTTEVFDLKYSDGLLTGGEHTVVTSFENSEQTTQIITTNLSKIDAAGTETKYLIEESTIDYDYDNGTRTETIRNGFYTGEESNIKNVSKCIYTTVYSENGQTETSTTFSWQNEEWKKANKTTDTYNEEGNIIDSKLETFNYISSGERTSLYVTVYEYDNNGNMTKVTENEKDPSTEEQRAVKSIITYEWIAA